MPAHTLNINNWVWGFIKELQDADIYTGQTSSNLNPIFEGEDIEAVRNTRKDSLSIHSPKTIDGK